VIAEIAALRAIRAAATASRFAGTPITLASARKLLKNEDARTDQQAAQLRERALALESQAVHVPQPVGDRLRASAARLRALADKHDRTRITAAEGQA
jgi:hypothetical protein